MSTLVITEQVSVEGYGDFCVLLKHGKILVDFDEKRPPKVLFPRHELIDRGLVPVQNTLSIGELGDNTLSLVALDDTSSFNGSNAELVGLRQVIPELSYTETQIAARASQLYNWLSQHQYCGRCGNKTQLATDERALICTNCDNRIYPSLAPCVIGVVVKGDEILLANGVRFNSDTYSALAGFIEAGESAEEAFAREVMEEVGIEVTDIEYVASQSWPFPNQLMFAFVAKYKSGNIKIDPAEIIHADWYKKTELPRIPGAYTIARRVINEALTRV